ncbi:uncharacterized protein EV422DRAFT_506275 [Fimicolochytrium jonesii]|uniref:uncharacterized protein n=1 Tax=Fimicolochytrium jonesii TaxID=1396493 RepID=UPI0022FE28D1|nr:uncharacterized protein EV422DRAFT_506275 [Fimicolochytrium jonesii]KAI8821057.1 hypothetical protein EV422DRAFT_506275 [Fimicolochytrium jonesii]
MDNLPIELLEMIVAYLPTTSIYRMRKVSESWKKLFKAAEIGRNAEIENKLVKYEEIAFRIHTASLGWLDVPVPYPPTHCRVVIIASQKILQLLGHRCCSSMVNEKPRIVMERCNIAFSKIYGFFDDALDGDGNEPWFDRIGEPIMNGFVKGLNSDSEREPEGQWDEFMSLLDKIYEHLERNNDEDPIDLVLQADSFNPYEYWGNIVYEFCGDNQVKKIFKRAGLIDSFDDSEEENSDAEHSDSDEEDSDSAEEDTSTLIDFPLTIATLYI